MKEANSKIAVLIVHGACFFAEILRPFRARLAEAGFETSCPQLPSCGDTRPKHEKAGLAEDAIAVQTAAKELIRNGFKVVILARSYGGMVACNAITKELYARGSPEDTARVCHLIFLSAFVPLPGNGVADLQEKYGHQSEAQISFDDDGTLRFMNASRVFYNDLEDEKQARALSEKATTQNQIAAAGTVNGDPPWKSVPSTYIYCLRDLDGYVPMQKSMVKDALDAGGMIQTFEVDAGHCPFFSKPDEVVRIIKGISESV